MARQWWSLLRRLATAAMAVGAVDRRGIGWAWDLESTTDPGKYYRNNVAGSR
jgi:hypothetical protein